MNTSRSLLLAVVLFVTALPAAAQVRFEREETVPARVAGVDAVRTQAFKAKLARVASMFAAMPEVGSPPNRMCTRLTVALRDRTLADSLMARAMANGSAGVSLPIDFDGRRCNRITSDGVGVVFNSLSAAFPPSGRVPMGDASVFALPAIASEKPGVVSFRDGRVLFTRPGVRFYTPVTKREYLAALVAEHEGHAAGVEDASAYAVDEGAWRRWLEEDKPRMLEDNASTLRELAGVLPPAEIEKMRATLDQVVRDTEAGIRAMVDQAPALARATGDAGLRADAESTRARQALAALGPARGALPACADAENPWSAGPDACPAGTMIVRANPALFQDADPGEVRLVFLSPGTGLERHPIEDEHFHTLRMAIYRQVDLQLLAQLVD